MSASIFSLSEWIGRTETVDDTVTATPFAALSATLDLGSERPAVGTALPPLWHWLYFLPIHPQSKLGTDGHASRGDFLPPVSQPRRMWAGGKFDFYTPLRIGDSVRRVSTIADVKNRNGRSGALTFVKVRHEIFQQGNTDAALVEWHDIVYRDLPQPDDVPPACIAAAHDACWQHHIKPNDALLFRYSALTFNGHRIHYDRRYVTETEGYPGLVVHGPLIATLLLNLVRRELPHAIVKTFEFLAVRPTFDLHSFSVHGTPSADGRTVHLWAQDHEGWLTMDATATLA